MLQRTKKTLLIIDDDRLFCDAVSEYFTGDKIGILTAHTGSEGLNICSQQKVDVVLLDQKLPDVKGVELCPSILSYNDQAKIIFATAYPSFKNAIEAIKVGAHDYLSKPFEIEELNLTIEKAFRTLDLERMEQVQTYKSSKESEETVLIGRHGSIAEVTKMVDLAAANNAPVIITGETGAGKSIVAKSIHYRSPVKRAAFISISCAALSENLIESELFGFEKGAFTGAVSARKGIFEMAEGGTLFLDEIGSLPIHLQSKLLGVLDDKKIKRLGGQFMKPVDVRIIAATNIELENVIKNGGFREDLYYRLSVIRIHLPPLRERLEDISELCNFFIRKIAPSLDIELSDFEVKGLMEYKWPGNVRELRNIIERSIILRNGSTIRPSELLGGELVHISRPSEFPLSPDRAHIYPGLDSESNNTLEEVQINHIKHALSKLSNNYTRTAEFLGISRSTLMRKIKSYGIYRTIPK
jgi:DNA-binding NtrC family response regulator